MHWRRFAVSSIPLDSLDEFDMWLQDRWLEKEKLLEEHARTGHFPSSLANGKSLTTKVRLENWWEMWRVCVILVSVTTMIIVIPSLWERLGKGA